MLLLCQPPAIIASLPPQTPPAVPLTICPQRTTGSIKSTSTASTCAALATRSLNLIRTTSTNAQCERRDDHDPSVDCRVRQIIVAMPILHQLQIKILPAQARWQRKVSNRCNEVRERTELNVLIIFINIVKKAFTSPLSLLQRKMESERSLLLYIFVPHSVRIFTYLSYLIIPLTGVFIIHLGG